MNTDPVPLKAYEMAGSPDAASGKTHTRPTFQIACWVLGLIAFAQLIALGTAINIKLTNLQKNPSSLLASQPPAAAQASYSADIKPRTLEEILAATDSTASDSITNLPQIPDPIRISPPQIPQQNSFQTPSLPPIANPRVARLVEESRTLQMDGDYNRAILKLEEAKSIEPEEPAIIFAKAQIFEDMAIYVKAADEYQKIQQMGIKAGVYFNLATQKLTESIDTKNARRNIISIGQSTVIKKSTTETGAKQTSLQISLRARPDTPINPDDVTVDIYFYDKIKGNGSGEIKGSSPSSVIEKSWRDNKVDWRDIGHEEVIQVTYLIPGNDSSYNRLFGEREYYGHVIELVYKGDIIDQKAEPRYLNSHHGRLVAPQYPTTPWDTQGDLLPSLNPSQENFQLPALPTQ